MNNLIDISNNIKDFNNILAHKSTKRSELLKAHIDRCLKIFYYIDKNYNVINKLERSLNKLSFKKRGKEVKLNSSEIELIKKMFTNTIAYHDIGKINVNYQVDILENAFFNNVKNKNTSDTDHSPYSAIIFINEFENIISKGKELQEKTILRYIMLAFADLILKHHSNLGSLEESMSENNIETLLSKVKSTNAINLYKSPILFNENIGQVVTKFINNYEYDNDTTYTIYLWCEILYSLLVSCDFIATFQFFNNISNHEFDLGLIENIDELIEDYNNTDVAKGIYGYSKDNKYFHNKGLPLINCLRSEIALEVHSNIKKYKGTNNIFNMKAPTGSGKTFSSLLCALELLSGKEHKKLFYIFPVNTISTQTKKDLDETFKGKILVQEINSIAQIPEKTKVNGEIDYQATLLDRDTLSYPIILTSHVNFLNMIFGTSRGGSMGLFQLFNSVVILDEVQNYNNWLWREMVETLYVLSDIMNIKVIFMSATLPNLQNLIGFKRESFVDLLSNSNKYFEANEFKNRVVIDEELLKKKICSANIRKNEIERKKAFDILKNKIVKFIDERNTLEANKGRHNKSKFIIEFISKETAILFYDYIQLELDNNSYEILELDGDDNSYRKAEIIEKVKVKEPSKNIILVTTQVVEAGVNIDMDLGAKDAVFPDVDEQFLGRINRSCSKKNCKAFFFNLDSEKGIYKEDLRNNTNISNDRFMNCLITKDFDTLYQEVFCKIKFFKDNTSNSDMNKFYDNVKMLRYSVISDYMKLINNDTIEVFLPIKNMTIKDDNGNINVFNGEEIWNEYKSLIENVLITYPEKRLKLMRMRERLGVFTYSRYGIKVDGLEMIGGIYYVPNASKYMVNGKLNSKRFKEDYPIN